MPRTRRRGTGGRFDKGGGRPDGRRSLHPENPILESRMHANVPVRFGRGRLDSLATKGLAAYLIAGHLGLRAQVTSTYAPKPSSPAHEVGGQPPVTKGIQPPPPEPDGHVSVHPALQSQATWDVRPCAVLQAGQELDSPYGYLLSFEAPGPVLLRHVLGVTPGVGLLRGLCRRRCCHP